MTTESTCDTGVQVCDVSGVYRTIQRENLIKSAQNCIVDRMESHGETLDSSEKSAAYLQVLLGDYEHEVFYTVWLDSKHRVLDAQELFRGTVDQAAVYSREVVKAGLACNAAAVLIAHNHPSGVSDPSQGDIQITKRLKSALELVGINLLDHLVVGSSVTSMQERNMM